MSRTVVASLLKISLANFTLALIAVGAGAQQLPTCMNHYDGTQVPIITNQPSDSPAYSTLDPRTGRPEIFLDLGVLRQYESSQDTLTFIVLHECGHVNLGHLNVGAVSHKKSNQEELAADCYAAKAVHQMGYTQTDLQRVLFDVDKLPKDPDHPAGPVRGANITRCFNGN